MRTLPRFVPLLALTALVVGCNPAATTNQSAVVLAVNGFKGGRGTGGKIDAVTGALTVGPGIVGFFSDVVTDAGTTTEDTVFTTIRSLSKSNVGATSQFYTVQIESYTVVFTRLDGKNIPGVDVPFPQTLPIAGFIPPNGTADIETPVVLPRQKLDPPLRQLWFGEGQRIDGRITITYFGHDLVNNAVQATGSLLVTFQDSPG